MAVGIDHDPAALRTDLVEQESRRIRHGPESPGDGAGVEFEHAAVLHDLPNRFDGRVPVTGIVLGAGGILRRQVEVADDVRPVADHVLGQAHVIVLREIGVGAAVELPHEREVLLLPGIDRERTPVPDGFVDRGEDEIVVQRRNGAFPVELDPGVDPDLIAVLGREGTDLPELPDGSLLRHGVVGLEPGIGVIGEAEGGEAAVDCLFDHLAGRVVSVGIAGVGVKILILHMDSFGEEKIVHQSRASRSSRPGRSAKRSTA